MKKYLYLIKKKKIKSWLKFWLLTKDQVKYILSEILEGFSFDLQNTVKKRFKIFNIFGNSVQNGTPTPENPVPIHSVADDVNLLENMTIYNSNHYISPLLKLNPGTYTFNYTGDSAAGIYIRKNDGSNPTNGTVVDQKYTTNNITFSISETGNYYIHLYSMTIWEQLTMNNPKLQKGSTSSPYSPYNQGTVTIKQRGKNLLNVTATSRIYNKTLIVTVNNDKSITFNGMNSSNEPLYFRLAPNFDLQAGTYTLSNKNSNVGENSAIFYDDGGNFEPRSNIVTKTFSNIVTVKPYIKISIGATFDNFTIYPMIEQNLTATDYEPYQANDYTFQTEPLRSLPNGVKDTIEADGIHRRVGRVVLDGSEDNWGTVGDNRYYLPIQDKRSLTTSVPCNIVSNYFKSSDNAGDNILIGYMTEGYYTTGNKNIFFNYNGSNNDLAGFKTWLSTHNTEVLYELAEEIIEPYTEEQQEQYDKIKELYTFDGTTNIYSDDEVPPYLQIQYYMKGE